MTRIAILGILLLLCPCRATYSDKDVFQNNRDNIENVKDRQGNYLKTFELGYQIWDFCYDEKHQRLFFCFNDEIQFGYLDIKELM